MRKHLHWWVTLLFLIALAYDVVVWGAAAGIPDIGDKLQKTAHREALLANVYMGIGSSFVPSIPLLNEWGSNYFQAAVSEGFPRIKEDPSVAFDLIFTQSWNARHRTLKTMYWVPPLLALVAIFLWARRPKKIRLMGRR